MFNGAWPAGAGVGRHGAAAQATTFRYGPHSAGFSRPEGWFREYWGFVNLPTVLYMHALPLEPDPPMTAVNSLSRLPGTLGTLFTWGVFWLVVAVLAAGFFFQLGIFELLDAWQRGPEKTPGALTLVPTPD